MKLNIKDYLKRIGFNKNITVNKKTLTELHKKHLYNIPFENLSIHSGDNIILDVNLLSDKILKTNRGGYCYELNGMFFYLLKELGFKVKMISARVNNCKGGWSKEFDHLAVMVMLEDEWLADVGFGDNFIEPLKFEPDNIQKDLNGFYKIIKHDEKYYQLQRSTDGKRFTGEYIFTLKKRNWKEFEGMNKYHQTSPDSHFTHKKICSIATKDGRISLSSNKLTITKNKIKKEKELKDDKEFEDKLFEIFNIRI